MQRYTTTERKGSTTLMIQLLFEKLNISDAFGATTLGLNIDSAVDLAKDVATSVFGDGYSVKKPVEGIISLLTRKSTRQIIFCWNNMFFHGELMSVDANFNMFNKNGYPIMATVDMQIKQTDANATFASDQQYWEEALDRAFT